MRIVPCKTLPSTTYSQRWSAFPPKGAAAAWAADAGFNYLYGRGHDHPGAHQWEAGRPLAVGRAWLWAVLAAGRPALTLRAGPGEVDPENDPDCPVGLFLLGDAE